MRCEPRIAVVPASVRTAGPLITRLAAKGGIALDEAQQFVADTTGGTGADGKWSAFESVVFAPRQNIKTEYALARILAGLFLFREDYIVFSAHQVKTTTKVFRRLKRAIDRSPELGARIARVSNRIGAESIELATGQTLECVARSTNSGRGFTGSTIILDEAHELDADALAALLPMLATRPNPSVLYLLSLGNEHSSHLGGLRERALAGDPNVCWVEWSMGDDDRVDDRRVWAACNPAYPARILDGLHGEGVRGAGTGAVRPGAAREVAVAVRRAGRVGSDQRGRVGGVCAPGRGPGTGPGTRGPPGAGAAGMGVVAGRHPAVDRLAGLSSGRNRGRTPRCVLQARPGWQAVAIH